MIKPFYVYASYATLLVTWVLIGVSGYWFFLDRDVPTTHKLVSVIPKEAHPGEVVTVKYQITRLRACTLTFTRILQSEDETLTFPLGIGERVAVETEVGKTVDSTVTFVVPLNIEPGRYEFFSRLSYECNPAQRFNPIVLDSVKAVINVTR